MSLLGAMNAAISGLTAQSAAFGNISDNVANSQTIGFKRTDTSFIDYLTTSTPATNEPGAVVARPDYINNVQGSVTQSDNPLALAITGNGFFSVSQPNGTANGLPTFSPQQLYTRAGDFTMDANGFLVNSAGNYLNGWLVNPVTNLVNQAVLAPIKVAQGVDQPVATSVETLSANLPATPALGTPISTQLQVYDTLGTLHTVTLNWTQIAPSDWTVAVNSPNDIVNPAVGGAEIQFGPLVSGNPVTDGTMGNIINVAGSVATAGYAAGTPATLTFATDFGLGPQTITLNLGTYGLSTGLTQYAGTQYSLNGLTQNGVPPGNFSSVATQANGNVVVGYDNGQTKIIAQVPVVDFAAPNGLQRQNGQAFTATINSGQPQANSAGANGAGKLIINSTEGSNVDIATEFAQLIVAQRAYSANAKIITTADDLLTTTIDMKR
jgi:flagellar hook protein FlgE